MQERLPGTDSRSAAVPEGHNTVSPWIISRDTGALIDFAKAAFARRMGDPEWLARMEYVQNALVFDR